MIQTTAREATSVTVGTSLTTLVTFDQDTEHRALLGRCTLLNIEVTNTGGTNAFDQFEVQIKMSASGSWQTLRSTWASTDNMLLSVSTDPAALSPGSTAIIQMYVGPVYALRIQAAGAASTTADCRAIAGS